MLLTGTFARTIDDKQRLAIPKRLRDSLTVSGSQPKSGSNSRSGPQNLSESGPGNQPNETGKSKSETSPDADSADRIAEPGVLYVAPGTDGSLALYTEESFVRLGAQLAASPPTGQDVRAFSRLFYSQAARLELDRQGRIRIPAELAALARLQKDVVLVGVGDHLELWDKTCWEAYVQEQQAQYDRLAERAFQATTKP